MLSVRVTAAGAVIVASLCVFTAPVSACDDRYAKKCEKAAAAEFAASEAQSEGPSVRLRSRHVRVGGRRARLVMRTRAPGFTVKRERSMTLASGDSRPVSLPSESVLSRRFRGFIDPQPLAQNAFEALRKPHLAAVSLEPAAAMPADSAIVAAPATADAAPAPTDTMANVAVAPKQDRIAPVASIAPVPNVAPVINAAPVVSAAPAVTTVPPPVATQQAAPATKVLTVKPAALVEVAMQAPAQAATVDPAAPQAELTAAPPAKPADEPAKFPVHKLVLALCGALGAASALRFIVRA
jgi:hypothetical protein